MIVGLAEEVCQQIQEIDRLNRLKNNQSDVEATFNSLVQLKDFVVQLRSLVLLLKERLPNHAIQSVVKGMERLVRDVQTSEEKFENQPRQVKELTHIQKKAQELIEEIKQHWRRYAEESTKETLELLRLVGYLPEVEDHQAAYHALTSRLQHYINHTPLIPAQLAEFDDCLQQLNERLSNIQGLSTDVKKFLDNVLKDQATLVDLTDEVLQWCRQGEHAGAFIIGFARSKRG